MPKPLTPATEALKELRETLNTIMGLAVKVAQESFNEGRVTSANYEHPLNHEEVGITITLAHMPTGRDVKLSMLSPADSSPTVAGAIAQLGEQTMDSLYQLLES